MENIMKLFKALCLVLTLITQTAFAGKTFDTIKKRGSVKCGVTTGLAGFSAPNSKGEILGLDADICRAVAAAMFGDAKKVKFVQLSAVARFTALQSGEVDLLSRVTTYNLSRDTSLGFNFAPVTYYDGQAFMVRKKAKLTSALQLNKATVCVQQGTTTERNLADYFRANRMTYKGVVFESNDEVANAFASGRCDAFTTDSSGLAAERTKFKKPEQYMILPEVISKEPLAPVVRHGDDQWLDVVTWSVYALLEAEELGINSKNVDSFKKSKNPSIKWFLGHNKGNGKSLGLSETWAYNVIKEVGNYSEIFERTVGKNTPLKLERGLNALWTNKGLMYAPPLR
jgi:general L-amino acid transport system substrate-binding protein